MNKVLKVAYMSGGSAFALEPLKQLIKSNHEVIKIYTKHPKEGQKTRKKIKNYLLEEAKKNHLEVIMTDDFKKKHLINDLKKINPDFIVVYAYGVILPKEILEIPKYGCINIHTSLLPKWRGASPIQHSLLNNEQETGFTFIVMSDELDKGDILLKEKITITKNDNCETLLYKITELASKNLIKTLEQYAMNMIKTIKQKDKEATYCFKIKKEDTYINFNQKAYEIYGKIRAFNPNPGAKCYIKGELVKIVEAEVVNENLVYKKFGMVLDNNLLISCRKGAIRLTKIQRQGRKPMISKVLLNGWKIEKGLILNER